MVLSDDGRTTRTTLKTKGPPPAASYSGNRCRFRPLPLAIGCGAIAFLAALSAVALLKTGAHRGKPSAMTANRTSQQSVYLKVLFSTDYQPEDEKESLRIKNIPDLTEQLNAKLKGEPLRITEAFFREPVLLDGLICGDLLAGMALQWHLAALSPVPCATQNENACRRQFQNQLQEILERLLTDPLTFQFGEDRSSAVTLKLCSLTELTKEDTRKVVEKQATISARWRQRKTRTSTLPPVAPRDDSIEPVNSLVQNTNLQSSWCPLHIGAITLVQMAGEYGSRLQDDTRVDAVITSDLYQRYRTATVYEGLVYQLQVQLNCNGQIGRGSSENSCEAAQEIQAWIDFNNNEYDDGESRVLRRTVAADDRHPGNMYDLEIYIPAVDERNTLSGPHRLRLTVVPSEEYRRNCGDSTYKETRDYTVIIAPKGGQRAVAPRPDNLVYDNRICSLNSGKIALVLMAGQKGSEIRDDQPTSTALRDYRDQHHLGVTLYESTVYLIRIQLDCNWQLDQELFEKGCNLAQDVHVWIDLNNDGRYDESEMGAPYRWPVTSYLPEGIYDLQIRVPSINSQYVRGGRHRMRLVVMSSEHYLRLCGRSDYNETREYFVNIISKTDYSVPDEVTPISSSLLQNIVCSSNAANIVLILLPGEHRTQIRDDPAERELWNNAYHQRHPVVLYQDHIYLLRIQLDCSRQWNDRSTEHNCQLIYDVNVWIDLNDDGVFDSSENVAPYHWPLNSYTPKGVYDLQIYTPVIDTRVTKYGPHKMQLEVTMSEYYRQRCGESSYREIRNYNVYVVPYRTQAVDVGVPYVALSDGVCTQANGKIVLVIMAGEQGTQIRDNVPTNIVLRENQNRHHLAVSLYESTTYRLRVQLSCRQQADGSWSDVNCNLAQDVNVLIDFNNDGTFSEVESRVARRWPLHGSIPSGIYDFEIDLPGIDERITRSGSHRMRIVVTSSEEYRRKCGAQNTNPYEEREYTVNILPRTVYQEVPRSAGFCLPGNLVCTSGNRGIALVELSGEQNTALRDESRECSATNNYKDRSDLVVSLSENAAYTLYVRLYCVADREAFSGGAGCYSTPYFGVWIDFNDDGAFDQYTERVLFDNSDPNDERSSEYQMQLVIPELEDGGYYRNKPHRMRVLLTTNEQNLQACYSTGAGEARDYSVQIVPRAQQ